MLFGYNLENRALMAAMEARAAEAPASRGSTAKPEHVTPEDTAGHRHNAGRERR